MNFWPTSRLTKELQNRVAYLEAEITQLRNSLHIEQRRADAAVDRLLVVNGIAPITPIVAQQSRPVTADELLHIFDEVEEKETR